MVSSLDFLKGTRIGKKENNLIKVLMIIGTRPEIIKCFPVIKALREDEDFDVRVVFTGQHRELLDMMIEDIGIDDYINLRIFEDGQSLSKITSHALEALDTLEERDFDYCLVQGDTTTVFAGALWAFYNKIKVGHIEAGLRSENIYSPYPEEANRKMVSQIAHLNFAPTEAARENLIHDGIDENSIFVTGNTVIDALQLSYREDYKFKNEFLNNLPAGKKVLMTAHRRENQDNLEEIFTAIRDAAVKNDAHVIFPMHLTPRIREAADKYLAPSDNFTLIEPISYYDMVHLISQVDMVVTDSGGLQEEAPGFGKPVLVIRRETERPEGIEAGTCKLVGNEYKAIYENLDELLQMGSEYEKMSHAVNPYGDGKASLRIRDILKGDKR